MWLQSFAFMNQFSSSPPLKIAAATNHPVIIGAFYWSGERITVRRQRAGQEHADYHCKLFAGGGSTMTNVRTCCRVVQLNDDKCGDKFLYLGGVTTAEPAAEWPVNLLETLEWSPLPNRLGFHKSWSTEQPQYLSISLIREWNLFFRNLVAFPFRDLDLILFSSHAILKLKPGRRFNFVWFKIFIYGMLYNVNCWADEILRNNILWSM